MSITIIRFENISFSYNREKVLKKISFHVEKGDFLGLIGPNGSGKTTLLRILLGLIKPQSGHIEIFRKRSSAYGDKSKIGYVPQKAVQTSLTFPITVSEMVSLGRVAKCGVFHSFTKLDQSCIRDALIKVDMWHLKDRKISELSTGQQQRVFIAKALVSEPEILILDEPFAGVDIKAQDSFYQLLSDLNKQGLTIIFVSHDIDVIVNEVNKLACLNKTLIFHGTPKDFLKKEYFEKLYGKSRRLILHAH